MKKFLLILLFATTANAETINFYAVPVSLVTKAEALVIKNKGRVDKYQPIRDTLVLTPLNTNYYIISNAPSPDIDLLVAAGKAFLYQSYTFESGRMSLTVDNSHIYNMSPEWAKK